MFLRLVLATRLVASLVNWMLAWHLHVSSVELVFILSVSTKCGTGVLVDLVVHVTSVERLRVCCTPKVLAFGLLCRCSDA